MRRIRLLAALLALGCRPGERATLPEPGSYELHPSLEMQLFAAEPHVVDPVALTFDAAERMYVVEMRDYPLGVEGEPGGTIRLIEDLDGDGRADRSTVFAEDLSFPTSIAPWRGGVLVTAPPELLYLEDTDGDRRADVREVILEGFNLGVTDSNVNGLRWGLDNRLHGLNGGNGGTIGRPRDPPQSRLELRRADFRWDPRSGTVERTYHTSAGFGLMFDEWGRSFSPYNIDHLQQRIVPVRYLEREPALAPVHATENISVHGPMARLFPLASPETRPNHPEQAGFYTAAGGMGYLDFAARGLPRGVLVCDVVSHVVSRELLRMEGPVYVAERAPEERGREFFASRDPAFRPIAVEMGPDGALYLADMQREVIEHPDYIPAAMRRELDLRAGSGRGRIYRIVPRGGLGAGPPPLSRASPPQLVGELDSPSRRRRMTAQRLLVEAGEAPREALRELAREGESALGRLHALWTLEGLGALDEELVLGALADPRPEVRENALLLAEGLLPGSAQLSERLLEMAGDPVARVRFQTALTLGELEHPRRQEALTRILLADSVWRWSRVAVESSIGSGAAALLLEVLERGDDVAEAGATVLELADLVGARLGPRDGPLLARVLEAALASGISGQARTAILAGLASGLERAQERPAPGPVAAASLDRLMIRGPDATVAAAWRVRRRLGLADGSVQRRAVEAARARILEREGSLEERLAAVDVLALGAWEDVEGALFGALDSEVSPSELQARAIAALGSFEEPELGPRLVASWRRLGPQARRAALRLLLRRPEHHDDLLLAVEQGRLTVGELALDLEQRRRLLRRSTPEIRERAARLLSDEEYGNRAEIVDDWLRRLPAEGSAERGEEVFVRLCAQCHVAGAAGHAVGPDIESLRHRSLEDLVSNILDPSMAINPAYAAYELELVSGASEVGLLEAETAQAVTLLQAGGSRRVVARSEIASMRSLSESLMPTGLEQGLTPVQLRDLVAFIQRTGR